MSAYGFRIVYRGEWNVSTHTEKRSFPNDDAAYNYYVELCGLYRVTPETEPRCCWYEANLTPVMP